MIVMMEYPEKRYREKNTRSLDWRGPDNPGWVPRPKKSQDAALTRSWGRLISSQIFLCDPGGISTDEPSLKQGSGKDLFHLTTEILTFSSLWSLYYTSCSLFCWFYSIFFFLYKLISVETKMKICKSRSPNWLDNSS